MGGKTAREEATEERRLRPETMQCRKCGRRLRLQYTAWRKVAMLGGMVHLKVSIGRCENSRYHVPTPPLEEGHVALPHDEYGLDVLASLAATWQSPARSVAGRYA